MGLWRGVELRTSGPVALRNPAVMSKVDSPDNVAAHLTVTAQVKNGTNAPVHGTLTGKFESVTFSQPVDLGPNETKDVTFDPTKFSQLNVDHPRLWWPAQMGKPELYSLRMDFSINGKVSDASDSKFGIREVDSELNKNDKRFFTINGKKILIRGGGWSPDAPKDERAAR